jgi:hypothetical protein
VRIETADEAGPGRHADGAGRIATPEDSDLFCQCIEIGRFRIRVASESGVERIEVVTKNDHHIRFIGIGQRQWSQSESKAEN